MCKTWLLEILEASFLQQNLFVVLKVSTGKMKDIFSTATAVAGI